MIKVDKIQLLDSVQSKFTKLTISRYSNGVVLTGSDDSEVSIPLSEINWLIQKLTNSLNGEWISE